jgi:hypothetical protein
MDQVPEVGTIRDSERRKRLARKDSKQHQLTIEQARWFIFRNGVPVSGASVERLLNPTSHVPTRVSFHQIL